MLELNIKLCTLHNNRMSREFAVSSYTCTHSMRFEGGVLLYGWQADVLINARLWPVYVLS